MSKVSNCSLKRVGELNFDFSSMYGCNSFSFGIMMCFPWWRERVSVVDPAFDNYTIEKKCYS